MPELKNLRWDIDDMDEEIIKLLAKRMDVSKKIGDVKQAQRTDVVAQDRESSVIERIRHLASAEGMDPDAAERIYLQIIKESREVQR